MFRKLTLLALAGAVIAWLLKDRSGAEVYETTPAPAPESVAEVRDDQPASKAEEPPAGPDDEPAVIPDTSADDPLVQEQEDAAAAEAAEIGGGADTVTADVDPELRPVVEGSGDAEETFEATEDEGR